MFNFIKSFALATGLFVAAGAQAVTLDFDTDAAGNPIVAGQIIDDEYAGFGVDVSISTLNFGGGPDLGVAFDSNSPTGGDGDLATPGYGLNNNKNLGNLLIVQENGGDFNNDGFLDVAPSDDEAGGGRIDMIFTVDQLFAELDIIDIEEAGGAVRLLKDGAVVATQALLPVGDNGYQLRAFNNILFDQIRVDFAGSGGIGEVRTVAVPEPSTWFLLSTALFGVMLATQRKRGRVRS